MSAFRKRLKSFFTLVQKQKTDASEDFFWVVGWVFFWELELWQIEVAPENTPGSSSPSPVHVSVWHIKT